MFENAMLKAWSALFPYCSIGFIYIALYRPSMYMYVCCYDVIYVTITPSVLSSRITCTVLSHVSSKNVTKMS